MRILAWLVVLAAAGAAAIGVFGVASPDGREPDKETAAIVAAMPTAKLPLAEGLREAAKGPAVALSARFEIQDEGPGKGRLMLSVFVAKKGLVDEPWAAAPRQVWGLADGDKWTPEVDGMEDEDLARAGQQITLLALTTTTLAEVVARVETAHVGTVIAAAPALRDRKPVFVVETANEAKVSELLFDLKTGEPLDLKTK
jgi:hypothetical protein